MTIKSKREMVCEVWWCFTRRSSVLPSAIHSLCSYKTKREAADTRRWLILGGEPVGPIEPHKFVSPAPKGKRK